MFKKWRDNTKRWMESEKSIHWGYLIVALFICLQAAQFFLALANIYVGSGFIPVEPLVESARGNAVAAVAGIFAAYGALFTFVLNFNQKQVQSRALLLESRSTAEANREQARRQHEYEMIFREYSELSRDFASEHELSRINAAINLVRIAKLPDPRFEEEVAQREGGRNWILEKYPWFKSACLQMATACVIYEGEMQKDAVKRAISELAHFGSSVYINQNVTDESGSNFCADSQPLLEYLFVSVCEANSSSFKQLKALLLIVSTCDCEDFLSTLESEMLLIGLSRSSFSHVLNFDLRNGYSLDAEQRNRMLHDVRVNIRNIGFCQSILQLILSLREIHIGTFKNATQNVELTRISDVCFAGIKLFNINLSYISFVDCTFERSIIYQSGITMSVFENCNFENGTLMHSDCRNTTFRVNARSIKFLNCNLGNSVFSGCDIENHQTINCSLENTDLSKHAIRDSSFAKGYESNWGVARFHSKDFKLEGDGDASYEFSLDSKNACKIQMLWLNSCYEGLKEDLQSNLSKEQIDSLNLEINSSSKVRSRTNDFSKEYQFGSPEWWKD